jgi:AcrR family transcriptional regulator
MVNFLSSAEREKIRNSHVDHLTLQLLDNIDALYRVLAENLHVDTSNFLPDLSEILTVQEKIEAAMLPAPLPATLVPLKTEQDYEQGEHGHIDAYPQGHMDSWYTRNVALVALADGLDIFPLSEAFRDVIAERQRVIDEEGFTPEHDDEHTEGELALGAAAYAIHAAYPLPDAFPDVWPWDFNSWKPAGTRRCLVKAGQLIVAAIERFDRANSAKAANHD